MLLSYGCQVKHCILYKTHQTEVEIYENEIISSKVMNISVQVLCPVIMIPLCTLIELVGKCIKWIAIQFQLDLVSTCFHHNVSMAVIVPEVNKKGYWKKYHPSTNCLKFDIFFKHFKSDSDPLCPLIFMAGTCLVFWKIYLHFLPFVSLEVLSNLWYLLC